MCRMFDCRRLPLYIAAAAAKYLCPKFRLGAGETYLDTLGRARRFPFYPCTYASTAGPAMRAPSAIRLRIPRRRLPMLGQNWPTNGLLPSSGWQNPRFSNLIFNSTARVPYGRHSSFFRGRYSTFAAVDAISIPIPTLGIFALCSENSTRLHLRILFQFLKPEYIFPSLSTRCQSSTYIRRLKLPPNYAPVFIINGVHLRPILFTSISDSSRALLRNLPFILPQTAPEAPTSTATMTCASLAHISSSSSIRPSAHELFASYGQKFGKDDDLTISDETRDKLGFLEHQNVTPFTDIEIIAVQQRSVSDQTWSGASRRLQTLFARKSFSYSQTLGSAVVIGMPGFGCLRSFFRISVWSTGCEAREGDQHWINLFAGAGYTITLAQNYFSSSYLRADHSRTWIQSVASAASTGPDSDGTCE
ncbi:hypothetical protein C8R45DRAFT_931399 [Mycena sanguinolenta]|nr:hypothetical protein C8R45DRAFT_931399 [Mycena sanguinolenta]